MAVASKPLDSGAKLRALKVPTRMAHRAAVVSEGPDGLGPDLPIVCLPPSDVRAVHSAVPRIISGLYGQKGNASCSAGVSGRAVP